MIYFCNFLGAIMGFIWFMVYLKVDFAKTFKKELTQAVNEFNKK